MRDRKQAFFPLALLVLAGLGLAGCGPRVTKSDLTTEEKHILKIASLYSEFRSKHRRPPNQIEELKTFARGLNKEDLSRRGIDDVESAFTSPRDHQPYKLVGPQPPTKGKGGPPMPVVVVYETTGVQGKRMTASGMGGGAAEMDEETLKKYVPNP